MHEGVYGRISECRVCGGPLGEIVLDLGKQALTGMFLKDGKDVPVCPMSLSACADPGCGLVQLNEVYDLTLLYGAHYGYASRLNASMVSHLKGKAQALQAKVPLSAGDVVIDIGSNDATTLGFFGADICKIGVDATGAKFQKEYNIINAELIPHFFPTAALEDRLAGVKAKIISSYSCFYDLPDPAEFAAGVARVLAPDGLWCLEQSYLPAMLATNSFDTVCHEHLEYYRLIDIANICRRAGLKVVDIAFNDVNGGSFSVDVAHAASPYQPTQAVAEVCELELRTDWSREFARFRERIDQRKYEFRALMRRLHAEGRRVAALGASTKGNVLLQYFGLCADDIEAIGEVNVEKFGCETPGTGIPIIPENELLALNPDYIIILPWHFRKFFEKSSALQGRNLIFPLPSLEVFCAS